MFVHAEWGTEKTVLLWTYSFLFGLFIECIVNLLLNYIVLDFTFRS